MDVSTGDLGVMGVKPKWMQIFDDILPAIIGVILLLNIATPPISKMYLFGSSIALILNTAAKILGRLGGNND